MTRENGLARGKIVMITKRDPEVEKNAGKTQAESENIDVDRLHLLQVFLRLAWIEKLN